LLSSEMNVMSRIRGLAGAMRSAGPRAHGWMAFGAYVVVSILFFGLPVLGDMTGSHVGVGGRDAKFFMWCLRYWPDAFSHARDPFVTSLLWAPAGFNLAWTTSIPGLGFLAAPITLLIGPVATFNLIAILAPALAGWAAYLLARRITRAFWPSLLGGYLFGFSTHMLGQLRGHPNLYVIAAVPLCAYLVLRRLDGSLSRVTFAVLLCLTFVFQFLVSTEVFLTMTIFGGVAFLAGLLAARGERRRDLVQAGILVSVCYLATAVVVSPYLYDAFLRAGPPRLPNRRSADLLALVMPRRNTLIGGQAFQGLQARLRGNITEDGSYLSIPAILVLAGFARSHWRTVAGKVLLPTFVVTVVCALGSHLVVAGRSSLPLPWELVGRLPLVKYVITIRFGMYTALLLGLMAAIWLADGGTKWIRWGLAGAVVVFLLPNLPAGIWHADIPPTPSFFTAGTYRDYLQPDEIVLFIPASRGEPLLWQLSTDFYFRMADGRTGVRPARDRSRVGGKLERGELVRDDLIELGAYLEAHEVRTIMVEDQPNFASIRRVVALLGWEETDVGGMALYRRPP
jgi:hypothetical protein